ncbi:MAG: segregation/condensation protein A [Clostridia bacterium]|nr:segregation/condensation protein A [Clostridia bacterium]
MEQISIKIDNFEGPLDLLMHLIEKNKMDIMDIKISIITDQYLEYLNKMREMNLEITSEFIVMASRLIYLKSKSLLPSLKDDEMDDSEFDLVAMLVEYKRYKEYTYSLRERLDTYYKRIYKLPSKIDLPTNKLEQEFSPELIPEIYEDFLFKEQAKKNLQADNIKKLALSEKYTVQSKIREIIRHLLRKPKFIFNKLFSVKKQDKAEVVTAFLSLLELSKMSRIKVEQNKLFGDIEVEKIAKVRAKG